MRRPGRFLLRALVPAAGLILALWTPASLHAAQGSDSPRVVTITAKRYEFVPNRIELEQGETVTLRLTTEDVTHGFFMRALGIDEIIEPGHVTEVTITPSTPGTYTIICDHFCGAGHSSMHMKAVVE